MPDINSEPVLKVDRLVKTYCTGNTEINALAGVDLTLYEREMVALAGPSGSGKSCLLNIIGGIDQATSGMVLFKKQNLTRLKQRELAQYRRDHVGFIFPFYNLIPNLSARQNVALVANKARNPLKSDEALAMVGLSDHMDRLPNEMTEEEKQRVAIARAIVKNPKVLLCDEPTGAFDTATGCRVLEALIHINRELGPTTVIISCSEKIQKRAHRVFFLKKGAIDDETRNYINS